MDGPGSAEDELAVRNLIAAAARLADSDDVDAYVTLFTPDAEWDLPGAARRGRRDIRDGAEERRAEGTVGPGTGTRHTVGTVVVRLDGDRATASSTWQFFTHTDTAPRLARMGTYHDDLVRTPDGWRIRRRVIEFG